MSMFYPAFINISGRRCVVVGGGAVAARKAVTLLLAGAEVVVIAPEICARMEKLILNPPGAVAASAGHPVSNALRPHPAHARPSGASGRIKHVARRYRKGDLRSAFIAVAATDDADVNLKICRDALALGILVNCVNPPEAGNFIVPSASERGGLTLSVSTAGKCPALSKLVRRELDDCTAGYPALLSFLEDARARLKEAMPRERDRAAALDSLAARLMKAFKTGPEEKALKLAEKELNLLFEKEK